MQQAGLEELAKSMKISRMGVHKHLALLQIEGVETRGNVGRPRMMYQLNPWPKFILQISSNNRVEPPQALTSIQSQKQK